MPSSDDHLVFCQKLKQWDKRLEYLPIPNALGQVIYEHIGQKAWQMWLERQTVLMNEYRLSLLDPQSQNFLEEEMKKFLLIT